MGRIFWTAFWVLAISLNGLGQQIVTIDWSSANPSLAGAPATIDRKVTLQVIVTNVNDILYQYSVNTAVSTAAIDDLANLLAVLNPGTTKAGGEDACSGFKSQLSALETSIKTDPNLNPSLSGGAYSSIALKDSLAAWTKLAPLATIEKLKTTDPSGCVGTLNGQTPKGFDPVYDWIKSVDARVNAPGHQTDPKTCTLSPGQQCTVTVNEYFIPASQIPAGQPPPSQLQMKTTAAGKTFTITPASNILVLSAGFMATTLAARTYTSANVPGQTLPVLAVGNNSRIRPGAVALLNYEVPRLDSYEAGLALSAGPVITFGSGGANVSTLGFFAGISVHFWHRLYITPGFHFGQFADFPKGFGDGTPIPTNVATPTALNRWTSRFAVAITFQTPNFSKLTGGGSTTTTASVNPANQTKTTPNKSAPAPAAASKK